MSEISAWMPLYIGDYLADTMDLSGAEHGAYLLLIMHYWRSGPLPDDDRALAAIARTERKEWCALVGPIVRRFFCLTDGRLHHKRIDSELAKAEHNSSKRRDAANARWIQERSKRSANADANASNEHEQSTCKPDDPRAQSPSLSPTSLRSVKPQAAKRKGAVPGDWWPDAKGIAFAHERTVDPAVEVPRFRDFHAAKGNIFADIPAAWRTWCQNHERFNPRASLLLDQPRMTGGF